MFSAACVAPRGEARCGRRAGGGAPREGVLHITATIALPSREAAEAAGDGETAAKFREQAAAMLKVLNPSCSDVRDTGMIAATSPPPAGPREVGVD